MNRKTITLKREITYKLPLPVNFITIEGKPDEQKGTAIEDFEDAEVILIANAMKEQLIQHARDRRKAKKKP